jgi:hypothetical protein
MGLRTWLGLRKKSKTRHPGITPRKIPKVLEMDAPAGSPVLAVFGDFDHFLGSTLANVIRGRWRAVSADNDEQGLRSAVAFLKWAPWSEYSLPDHLRRLTRGSIINDTNFSCDKQLVQEIAARSLGYSSAVDPMTHVGPCVVKSRRNATHDGRVVTCPLPSRDPTLVYEVLIDNRVGAEEIHDYRLLLVFGEMPVAYVKYRPIITRFADQNSRVTLTTPEALLSAEEIAQCQTFAERIGMEYGELDVLRDAASDRIYIVDANNTPCGPPPQLTAADRAKTLGKQFECIAPAFVRHCQRRH